jgi:hypothetical protein
MHGLGDHPVAELPLLHGPGVDDRHIRVPSKTLVCFAVILGISGKGNSFSGPDAPIGGSTKARVKTKADSKSSNLFMAHLLGGKKRPVEPTIKSSIVGVNKNRVKSVSRVQGAVGNQRSGVGNQRWQTKRTGRGTMQQGAVSFRDSYFLPCTLSRAPCTLFP